MIVLVFSAMCTNWILIGDNQYLVSGTEGFGGGLR